MGHLCITYMSCSRKDVKNDSGLTISSSFIVITFISCLKGSRYFLDEEDICHRTILYDTDKLQFIKNSFLSLQVMIFIRIPKAIFRFDKSTSFHFTCSN